MTRKNNNALPNVQKPGVIFTLEEAFNYFHLPAKGNAEASKLNNERCIRAVAFLLYYSTGESGADDLPGVTAHTLARVLETCASALRRIES